jgi:hypothetical protein
MLAEKKKKKITKKNNNNGTKEKPSVREGGSNMHEINLYAHRA